MERIKGYFMRWGYCGGKVDPAKRAKYKSAVDHAAYIERESFFSEKHQKIFSRKVAEDRKSLFEKLPTLTPDGEINTETLWNLVEQRETKKGNQTAKTFVIALPRQTTKEENRAMVLELQQEVLRAYGAGCSATIHYDHKHNPHCHFMLTTRPMKNGEFCGNKHDCFSKKGKSSKELKRMRKVWENIENRYLEKYGVFVSCERKAEPEKHLGILQHRIQQGKWGIKDPEKPKQYELATQKTALEMQVKKLDDAISAIETDIQALDQKEAKLQTELQAESQKEIILFNSKPKQKTENTIFNHSNFISEKPKTQEKTLEKAEPKTEIQKIIEQMKTEPCKERKTIPVTPEVAKELEKQGIKVTYISQEEWEREVQKMNYRATQNPDSLSGTLKQINQLNTQALKAQNIKLWTDKPKQQEKGHDQNDRHEHRSDVRQRTTLEENNTRPNKGIDGRTGNDSGGVQEEIPHKPDTANRLFSETSNRPGNRIASENPRARQGNSEVKGRSGTEQTVNTNNLNERNRQSGTSISKPAGTETASVRSGRQNNEIHSRPIRESDSCGEENGKLANQIEKTDQPAQQPQAEKAAQPKIDESQKIAQEVKPVDKPENDLTSLQKQKEAEIAQALEKQKIQDEQNKQAFFKAIKEAQERNQMLDQVYKLNPFLNGTYPRTDLSKISTSFDNCHKLIKEVANQRSLITIAGQLDIMATKLDQAEREKEFFDLIKIAKDRNLTIDREREKLKITPKPLDFKPFNNACDRVIKLINQVHNQNSLIYIANGINQILENEYRQKSQDEFFKLIDKAKGQNYKISRYQKFFKSGIQDTNIDIAKEIEEAFYPVHFAIEDLADIRSRLYIAGKLEQLEDDWQKGKQGIYHKNDHFIPKSAQARPQSKPEPEQEYSGPRM